VSAVSLRLCCRWPVWRPDHLIRPASGFATRRGRRPPRAPLEALRVRDRIRVLLAVELPELGRQCQQLGTRARPHLLDRLLMHQPTTAHGRQQQRPAGKLFLDAGDHIPAHLAVDVVAEHLFGAATRASGSSLRSEPTPGSDCGGLRDAREAKAPERTIHAASVALTGDAGMPTKKCATSRASSWKGEPRRRAVLGPGDHSPLA